jgi:TPR repeat protein
MTRALFAAVLSLWLTTSAWAGFDEGLAAYERGDYATAVEEWLPIAEQGHASAQVNLAAARGSELGRKNRDIIAKKMTAADVSKAQRLAREWLEKHGE